MFKLTEEQKAHLKTLDKEAKRAYIAELKTEWEKTNPPTSKNVDDIEELKQQNSTLVEQLEESKKNASKHQKRIVKKKQETPPEDEEKSIFKSPLLWLIGGFVGYVGYKMVTTTKADNEVLPLETGNNTVNNSGDNYRTTEQNTDSEYRGL